MLSKILKILTQSISSVTGVIPWAMTMKPISKQDLSAIIPQDHHVQEKLSPKFSVGDLVQTSYISNLESEERIGIIVGIDIHEHKVFNTVFYEVYFGENKYTLMEGWLNECKEEKS